MSQPIDYAAADPDSYRMSIGDHLEELRRRLIAALAGCGGTPPRVAQADEVYASIRQAEIERARAQPEAAERISDRSILDGRERKSEL